MVARLITYNKYNNRQRRRERNTEKNNREAFDQKTKSNNNARCHCLNGRAPVNALHRTLNESDEMRKKERRPLPMQGTKPTSSDLHCVFLILSNSYGKNDRIWLSDKKLLVIQYRCSLICKRAMVAMAERRGSKVRKREREKRAENQYHF